MRNQLLVIIKSTVDNINYATKLSKTKYYYIRVEGYNFYMSNIDISLKHELLQKYL